MNNNIIGQNTTFKVHGHVDIELIEYLPKALERINNEQEWIDLLQYQIDKLFETLPTTQWETDSELKELIAQVEKLTKKLDQYKKKNVKIVKQAGWDNLILDSGLNLLATNSFAGVFRVCVVGTGNSTPTVGQSALDAESARTSNYLTSGGGCGTTNLNAYTTVMKRTFDFPLGALNGTYAEVGFSPSSSAGPNLYNRSLIQSSGIPTAVTVSSTQQLRVVFTHTITIGPIVITRDLTNITGLTTVTGSGAITATQSLTTVTASAAIFSAGSVNKAIKWTGNQFAIITAFTNATTVTVDRSQSVSSALFDILSDTEGARQFQNLGGVVGSVDGLGNSFIGTFEPASPNFTFFVSNDSTALPTTPTAFSRTGTASTNTTAVPQTYLGTFTREFLANYGVNDANHVIRSYGFGGASNPSLVHLFDTDKTKNNLFTLQFVCAISWSR